MDNISGTIRDHLILFYRQTIICINNLLANRPCYELPRMARFCQLLEEFIRTIVYCLKELKFNMDRPIIIEFSLTCNPTLNLYYWEQLMKVIDPASYGETFPGEQGQLVQVLYLIDREINVNYRIYSNLYNSPSYIYPLNTTPPQIIINDLQLDDI